MPSGGPHTPRLTAGRRLMSAREYKHRRGNPSEMTLWRDEKRGSAPKPIRINGRRYWFEDEVFDYLEQLAAQREVQG